MVAGFPDFQTWVGKGMGGSSIQAYSFSGAVAAGATGTIDLTAVAANTQHSFQQLTISCPDDTAIHKIQLVRTNDGWLFYENRFVTSGEFDIVGQPLGVGSVVRILITNNSTSALTFSGVITWLKREIG